MKIEINSDPTRSAQGRPMRLSVALAAAAFAVVPLWLKSPEATGAGLTLFEVFFAVVFVAALYVACREVIRLVISKRRQ